MIKCEGIAEIKAAAYIVSLKYPKLFKKYKKSFLEVLEKEIICSPSK